MADYDLTHTLAEGFLSLLEEARALSQREQELSHRLSVLNKEYLKFADTLPEIPSHNTRFHLSEKAQKGLEAYNRFKRKSFEKDFTTVGRRGDLQCPFRQTLPTPPMEKQSPPPSAQGSAKCPIRFLDHQSPEKVAQYFEEHKHEIPRSHEICVKRYQSNSQSIRQLDAKYGNLVSMIQGLGASHQPYLKDVDRNADRVERWAEGVSQNANVEEDENGEEDDRTGHFERSLKDVRLGESPSRPWGIRVPLGEREVSESPEKSKAPDTDLESLQKTKFLETDTVGTPQKSRTIETANFTDSPEKPKEPSKEAKCPFSMPKALAEKDESTSRSPRTEVVFKGPVFFGYSADDAIRMMQAGINVGQSR